MRQTKIFKAGYGDADLGLIRKQHYIGRAVFFMLWAWSKRNHGKYPTPSGKRSKFSRPNPPPAPSASDATGGSGVTGASRCRTGKFLRDRLCAPHALSMKSSVQDFWQRKRHSLPLSTLATMGGFPGVVASRPSRTRRDGRIA